MLDFLPKRHTALTVSLLASLFALPQMASAQMVGYGTLSPSSEVTEATIGSEFSLYRKAIAQRRGAVGAPSTRQDATTLTTQDAPSWNGLSSVWGSLDTKTLNGTYSGDSTNLLFGADALVGDSLIVGVIAGYSVSSITIPSGQRIKTKALSFGPYFSAQLSETLSLDGFAAFGKPNYDVDGGQFSGDKIFGNLTLSGSIFLENALVSPFISIASIREDLPAFTSVAPFPVVAYGATTIDAFVTTIGASVNFNPVEKGGKTYLPHAGFEVDFVRSDDGFGNITNFTAPRLSGGVNIISDAGALSLGADISRTSEGTTTFGANAAYFLQF